MIKSHLVFVVVKTFLCLKNVSYLKKQAT